MKYITLVKPSRLNNVGEYVTIYPSNHFNACQGFKATNNTIVGHLTLLRFLLTAGSSFIKAKLIETASH